MEIFSGEMIMFGFAVNCGNANFWVKCGFATAAVYFSWDDVSPFPPLWL